MPPTRLSAVAQKFSAVLNDRPFLVLPLFVALYGVRSGEVGPFCRLTASPFELIPTPLQQVLHSSPLMFFVGYPLTHIAGCRLSYLVVMSGGLVFFTLMAKRFVTLRYGARRNIAALMIFSTPILITLSQFIGKADAYLAALFLLFLTIRRPVLQALCAGAVVLSHREIGLLLLVSSTVLNKANVRTALAGALAGAALILVYHYCLLPSPPHVRSEAAALLAPAIAADLLANPLMHLFFTFGPFWLCILSARRLGLRWLLVFLMTLGVTATTLDFTRVFTLAALPLMISVIDELTEPQPAGGWGDYRLQMLSNLLPFCTLVQGQFFGDRLFDSRLPSIVGELNRMVRALR